MKKYRLFRVFFLTFITFFLLILATSIFLFFHLSKDLPSIKKIQEFTPPVVSKVLDCKGRLICEFYEEKRRPVPLEEIPKPLVDALIAVEDKRFYSHSGIDVIRVFGAIFANLKALRIVQGASTITQQLARNMFLTQKKSVERKLKEVVLAIRLEQAYSKEEILERYLNQVYFGSGFYGVEAAAWGYFGKPVKNLNIAECALLAALPKAPAYYSPYKNPEGALKRRNLFLKFLFLQKKISKEDYETALSLPLGINPEKQLANEAPYAIEMVRQYVEDNYGYEALYKQGLVIHTTIDLALQRQANIALETKLREIEENYHFKNTRKRYEETKNEKRQVEYLQGALVAIEVKTGFIKALVGGRDFRHSPLNRAVQTKRQPGSAFKVFVYTAAVDNGYSPSFIENDEPISIEVAGVQEPYEPKNYDHRYIGPMTLRKALALSRNVIAVKLIEKLTPQTVASYAYKMGITSRLRPYYSLALGSSEVSLLEMTRSFATLANSGKKITPILITKIEDSDGFVIKENLPSSEQVISPQTAFIMNSTLKSVLNEGTGYLIRRLGYLGIGAGKTGTTDDFTDAWFIGYTPNLSVGVWVGFDKKKRIFSGATGGVVAAPIWADFMKFTEKFYPQTDFPMPDSIIQTNICEASGLLATDNCPEARQEFFILGTEPKNSCSLHRH